VKKIITVINEHDVLISGYQKLFPLWQSFSSAFIFPSVVSRLTVSHVFATWNWRWFLTHPCLLLLLLFLEIFFRIIIYNEEFRVLEEYKLNFSNGVLDLVISVLAPWHLPISQQARPTPHTPEPSLYEAHTSTCRNVMMGPTQAHI